ncbi:transcriptional regulator [Thermomonospora cellulosilytica]|uniref:Uncharacterized protein n=1 Tax=Thermomonospora cellulosilytica TaxID=1411118 RepID=A0A7W3RBM0_9ACTN|nr:transcriptional regulator [Thermomonospora cellulosilytica]MBA9007588.1 hypothetical protein [Thermomonospora cellulosilytica]
MTTVEERRWLEQRRRLNERRAELGEAADRLYPGAHRVAGTTLLTRPEWVAPEPLPLESVRLVWEDRARPPAVTGTEAGLPPGYRAYSEAMGALAPPAVFENRPAYRLLAADLPELRLTGARYFQGVDVGEAVAHELAAGTPGLPLRSAVGDPCDLARRAALPAITTVTIRRGTGDYVLHWRDPAKVVHAGGLHQVMPVGVFQPATGDPREDLDLWHCMAREYAEEFLGAAEDYGPGFTHAAWPFFRRLDGARRDGAVRARLLGLGVDPLTFAVDLLTAVVVDDEAFAGLFGGLVGENAEGRVMFAPFDGTVPRPMQPAGAAALRLAWRHRDVLLSPR